MSEDTTAAHKGRYTKAEQSRYPTSIFDAKQILRGRCDDTTVRQATEVLRR